MERERRDKERREREARETRERQKRDRTRREGGNGRGKGRAGSEEDRIRSKDGLLAGLRAMAGGEGLLSYSIGVGKGGGEGEAVGITRTRLLHAKGVGEEENAAYPLQKVRRDPAPQARELQVDAARTLWDIPCRWMGTTEQYFEAGIYKRER